MEFKNPQHPIWSILKLTVLMAAMCLVLYLEATVFDATELRSIVYIFLVAAGAEGAIATLLARMNKE